MPSDPAVRRQDGILSPESRRTGQANQPELKLNKVAGDRRGTALIRRPV